MAISGIGAGTGLGSQALSQLQGLQAGQALGGTQGTGQGGSQSAQQAGGQGVRIQGPSQSAAATNITPNAVEETDTSNLGTEQTASSTATPPAPPAGSGRGQLLDISA